MGIVLPTEKRDIKSVNPHSLLIYALPKAGKTTIVSGLEDALIIEAEPGGANFISGVIIEVSKPKEFNEVLKEIAKSNEKSGKFTYDKIVVDTITKLDEWSEISGTYRYMNKPQGRNFNTLRDGQKLNHLDPRFETVHEIGQGFGYKYSRDEMTDWYDMLMPLAPHIILIAHIKDKFIESKSGDTVETRDINLTGKVKSIYSTRVDSIGYFHRKDGQGFLSFLPKDNLICGGRCKHLKGDILVSELQEDDSVKTYWDKIYLKEQE